METVKCAKLVSFPTRELVTTSVREALVYKPSPAGWPPSKDWIPVDNDHQRRQIGEVILFNNKKKNKA